jgi:predicted DNA-binding protein
MLENLLFLLLGWLLGLFGTIALDSNRRKHKAQEVKTGFRVELRDLRLRLACLAHSLARYSGEYSRKVLERTLRVLEDYEGDETADRVRAVIQKLLSQATDSDLAALGTEKRDNNLPSVKKFALPFLEAQMHEISLCTVDAQRKLLDVRAQLRFLNEQADELKKFFHMTYQQDIRGDNRERLQRNINSLYKPMHERCFRIIFRIEELLPELNNNPKFLQKSFESYLMQEV